MRLRGWLVLGGLVAVSSRIGGRFLDGDQRWGELSVFGHRWGRLSVHISNSLVITRKTCTKKVQEQLQGNHVTVCDVNRPRVSNRKDQRSGRPRQAHYSVGWFNAKAIKAGQIDPKNLNSSRKSFNRKKIIAAKSFELSFDLKPDRSTLKIQNTRYENNSI